MDVNILKRKNLISVYVVYKDVYKKQIKAEVHFIDKELCYLQADVWDNNLRKPKNNQKAQILVYTMNGLYIGKTKIVDTTVTLPKIMFTLALPAKWEYTQTRTSIRRTISLPFVIKYNDGYEVNGNTIDISTGGISFALTEPILPVYFRFIGNVEIDVSNSDIGNEDVKYIKSEVKYLREMSAQNASTYTYRFITMDSHNTNLLKLLLNVKEEV